MFSKKVILQLCDLLSNHESNPALLDLLTQVLTTDRRRLFRPKFDVLKPSGGYRTIVPAGPLLAYLHQYEKRFLVQWLPYSEDYCYTGKGVKAALDYHLGATHGVTIDLRNAFDSITYAMLLKMFGVCFPGATKNSLNALAYTMTYPVHFGRGDTTPQGCATSPYLFNGLMSSVDGYLQDLELIYSAKVTRYADNIAVTADHPFDARSVIREVTQHVVKAGFVVGKTAEFAKRPTNYLGAQIYRSTLRLDESKLANYVSLLDEAYNSPTPSIYLEEINGIWGWLHQIEEDNVPQKVLALFERYYAKIHHSPDGFTYALAESRTYKLFD